MMTIEPEERRNERRFGAALGLLGVFSSILSALLLTPILLRYLDQGEFGLYQLIGAFVGYLLLIDLGIEWDGGAIHGEVPGGG